MNRYETVFIIDPDVAEPDQEAIVDRIRSLISQHAGKLLVFDDWGVRKFAYEIQKKKQGHYIRIEYAGSGDLVYAIERFFRIDFRLLKFMTIVLEKNVDPDSLPAEFAGFVAEIRDPASRAQLHRQFHRVLPIRPIHTRNEVIESVRLKSSLEKALFLQQNAQNAIAHAHTRGRYGRPAKITEQIVVSAAAANSAKFALAFVDLEHHARIIGKATDNARREFTDL